MEKYEHDLRKALRTAIDQGMTASLSIGDAVDVAVMAADIYATAIRSQEQAKGTKIIHVVSWPVPNGAPMRQALGYFEQGSALTKANAEDGAEIFMLEVR